MDDTSVFTRIGTTGRYIVIITVSCLLATAALADDFLELKGMNLLDFLLSNIIYRDPSANGGARAEVNYNQDGTLQFKAASGTVESGTWTIDDSGFCLKMQYSTRGSVCSRIYINGNRYKAVSFDRASGGTFKPK